jgi:hypothetical protein
MNENIFLTMDDIDEKSISNDKENEFNVDLSNLLSELSLTSNSNSSENEDNYLNYINYEFHFNVKQLQLICDYYGIKHIKKANKLIIIHAIVEFENNHANYDVVSRRKQLWMYIDEIKKDKFMKKYLLF